MLLLEENTALRQETPARVLTCVFNAGSHLCGILKGSPASLQAVYGNSFLRIFLLLGSTPTDIQRKLHISAFE